MKTRQPTKTYRDDIARAINDGDNATVALVEDLMRAAHGTLDHLTAAEFDRAARQAHFEAVSLALMGALADYCEPLGLAVPSLRVA